MRKGHFEGIVVAINKIALRSSDRSLVQVIILMGISEEGRIQPFEEICKQDEESPVTSFHKAPNHHLLTLMSFQTQKMFSKWGFVKK